MSRIKNNITFAGTLSKQNPAFADDSWTERSFAGKRRLTRIRETEIAGSGIVGHGFALTHRQWNLYITVTQC